MLALGVLVIPPLSPVLPIPNVFVDEVGTTPKTAACAGPLVGCAAIAVTDSIKASKLRFSLKSKKLKYYIKSFNILV